MVKMFFLVLTAGSLIFAHCIRLTATTNNIVETSTYTVTAENSVKSLSQEDIDLIALVTMAEAEGECEEGQRLVIDVILNRMDSTYFPNTVYDVVYAPNQFSVMVNGRIERCQVTEALCILVREEMKERTNEEVMFFTAGKYSKYGTPMFRVENHYFSAYA